MKSSQKGFTLIELLVVIAIIGLLSSVVLAAVTKARISARDAERLSDAKQIVNALELYANLNGGNYPPHDATDYGGTQNYCKATYCFTLPAMQTALAAYLKDLPEDPTVSVSGHYGYRYIALPANKYQLVIQLEGSGWCLMRTGSLPVTGSWVNNVAPNGNANIDWCGE